MIRTGEQQIGPFTILRELGRGGMGVVYLARDTRLGRDVAIKALPEALAQDPMRLERFEREARALAQLNHPNVAGIHGVEEHEGARYLVLEYVEGETLADRIDRGSLPVDDALEIAIEIAQGVEAAHDAGVIHRDLKPGNVIVTPDGRSKVLDFGLARSEDQSSSSPGEPSESPTLTSPARHSPTVPGVILGTAAYMSPEQARGRRVDKRTDIWSFGVVLYEMLTGGSPFLGETVSDSIGAILHKDVDLDKLPAGVPIRLRRVLTRCLERDRNLRYRDIGDVRLELTSHAEPVEAQAAEPRGSRLITGILAAALVLALAALGVLASRRAAPELNPVHATIQPPADARILFSGDLAGPPVVSPDGTAITFCAVREGELRRLWVRDLTETEPHELEGTDGALFPFWSPNGREIGFFTTDSLRRFDRVSGTVRRVCSANQGRGATWTDDGRIIFAASFRGGLSIVDADGGRPVTLTELDDELHTSHRWPFAIHGTDQFVFAAVTSRPGDSEHNAVYLGSLAGESPRRIVRCDYRAESANGHLLYVRDGVLLASRLDVGRGKLVGPQRVLARDVAADLSTWHGQFSASGNGVIVYNRARESAEKVDRPTGYSWAAEGDRVTAFDYTGRTMTTYAVDMPMRSLALSPDGTMLAMDVISKDGFTDIWLHPTAFVAEDDGAEAADPDMIRSAILDPEPRRLTFLNGPEVTPVWAPDGAEIAFRWDGDDRRPRGIYRKRVGGGAEVLIHDNEGKDDYPADWTPDGKYLVTVTGTLLATEINDIFALPLDGGEVIPLVVAPGPDNSPAISPDGRWLAYASGSSSGTEVYVIPFAPAWAERDRRRRWLVSENGGSLPRWSREGDQLFYITEASVLVALDVDTSGDRFSFSPPRALFQCPWDIGRNYDVTPRQRGGGQPTFMFLDSLENRDAPASVIFNWQTLLDDRTS